MGHKFDAKNKRKLDSEERRRILPPKETLEKVGLKEGDIMADVGCGIGYFTFPASEIIGPTGHIYAMDISLEMLKEVDEKISDKGVLNITTLQTEENNLKVCEQIVSYAFICNVLHEAKDTTSFMGELRRIISENGRIAIIEWQKIEGDFGPPIEHRLDKGYVLQLLLNQGFKNIRSMEIGEHFYAVLGQK